MKKILAGIFVSMILAGCSSNYSDGFRMGIVRKFSKKGYIWKSYEGELLLGGVVSSGGDNATLVNEVWDFSIDLGAAHGEKIEPLIANLTRAAESGERVKLHYIQDTRPRPSFNTQYLVQNVEFVKEKK